MNVTGQIHMVSQSIVLKCLLDAVLCSVAESVGFFLTKIGISERSAKKWVLAIWGVTTWI